MPQARMTRRSGAGPSRVSIRVVGRAHGYRAFRGAVVSAIIGADVADPPNGDVAIHVGWKSEIGKLPAVPRQSSFTAATTPYGCISTCDEHCVVVEDQESLGLHLAAGHGDVALDAVVLMLGVDVDPVEVAIIEELEGAGGVPVVDMHEAGVAWILGELAHAGLNDVVDQVQLRGRRDIEDHSRKLSVQGSDLRDDASTRKAADQLRPIGDHRTVPEMLEAKLPERG